MIYTTNTIEGYHRQIRKVTKNKGAFTSDMALLKFDLFGHRADCQKMDYAVARMGRFRIPAKDYLWRENEH